MGMSSASRRQPTNNNIKPNRVVPGRTGGAIALSDGDEQRVAQEVRHLRRGRRGARQRGQHAPAALHLPEVLDQVLLMAHQKPRASHLHLRLYLHSAESAKRLEWHTIII